MSRRFNWGILGAGKIAKKFASDLKLLPNANLYAIGSKSQERANEFASQFGFEKAYGSYEEFASDPDIDIVYIASRHVGHYPDSLLCLNQGKAVLCEKPVAINQNQFERMIAVAKEKKVFFMEALWTKFIPSFIKCKEIITSGEIGEVKLIESDFCFNPPYNPKARLFDPYLGGGALLDVGIYPLFFALEIGSEITDLRALAKLDENGIDSTCTIILSHELEEQSVLSTSVVTPGRVESIVHGSKGMVRLNKWWHTPTSVDLMLDDKESLHLTFDEPGFGYQYEAVEVMKCIEAGKQESELWSWEHSRKLISLLDRVRELTGISYPEEVESL